MALHVKNAEELRRYGLDGWGSKVIPITEKTAPKAKKEKIPWPICVECDKPTSANNLPQYLKGGEVVICETCWEEG